MPAAESNTVLLDHPAPGVARLRLNRPHVNNALSLELQAQLAEYFRQLGVSTQIRCILLTGGEEVFAAGGDIADLAGAGPIDILQRHTEQVWAPIRNCPKPVVAAVCGNAYGGGCELAMLADIIIAGQSAHFCQPEIRIGIMPGIGGTQRLVRALGKAKAMQMALTGRPISAHEAWIGGLVSEVVEDHTVQAHALGQASVIASMSTLAVREIKEVMLAGMDASLDAALALERKANALLFASRDQKEGMQAFIEKRRPQFAGR